MSFSLAGSIITQSGTDTDLSGLSGIAGVTEIISGGGNSIFTTYDIGSLSFYIAGNLTIDGDIESLVGEPTKNNTAGNCGFQVLTGGTLNVGRATTINNVIRYSGGDPIRLGNSGAGNFAFNVQTDATLNVNGGRISQNGMFNFENGSYCEWHKGTAYQLRDQTADLQFRLSVTTVANSNKINFYDCVLDSQATAWSIFTTNSIGTAGFTLRRARYINFVNSAPDLTFDAFNNGDNVHAEDYSARVSNANNVNIVNFDDVSRRLNYRQEDGGRNGYARTRRNMNFEFIDIDGNEINNVSYHARDTDNGNRLNNRPADDLADKIYSAINTTAPFLVTFIAEVFSVLETNDNLVIDDRTNSADTIFTNVISYHTSIATVRPVLFGENSHGLTTTTLLPDNLITESNRSIVDAYVNIDNATEFYDVAKALLVDNYEGETQTIVSRTGDLIDAGDLDIVINPNAATIIDVTGSVLTIRSSAFVGSLTTTSTVTLLNGATVSGSITDSSGTLSNIRFTGVRDNTEVRLFTVDGNEFGTGTESSSGGIVTIPYTHTGTDIPVRAIVISLGFLNQTIDGITLTDNTSSVPVSQTVDRQYLNPL